MPDVPLSTTMIDGLLLAGGAGRRMGGQDKGLLVHRGRPLAAHMIALLREHSGRQLISCNRHLDVYAQWGRIFSDPGLDYEGPMAGLACLAAHSEAPWALLLPCDMPELRSASLLSLRLRASTGSAAVLGLRHGGKEQPLLSLWSHAALQEAAAAYQQGERSLRRFMLGRALWIDDEGDGFTNINEARLLITSAPSAS